MRHPLEAPGSAVEHDPDGAHLEAVLEHARGHVGMMVLHLDDKAHLLKIRSPLAKSLRHLSIKPAAEAAPEVAPKAVAAPEAAD